MAQLANVSLMFTAHQCVHTHATQLRNATMRFHRGRRVLSCLRQPTTTNLPSRIPARPPSPSLLLRQPLLPVSRMHAMDFVAGIVSSFSSPFSYSSRSCSSTSWPLSISSTNLVTMTNKKRARGCPLNYLYYVSGEVERALATIATIFRIIRQMVGISLELLLQLFQKLNDHGRKEVH